MNPDYEKNLESRIDRELKSLPDLEAPDSILSRVMAEIGRRTRLHPAPASWQTWPAPWRWASLAGLAAVFAGLCAAGYEWGHLRVAISALQSLRGHFPGWIALGDVVHTLAASGLLVLEKFSAVVFFSCVVAFVLAASLCLAAGSIIFRLNPANHERAFS